MQLTILINKQFALFHTAFLLSCSTAVQHERGPRTSTIRKQVALYFRGHKEVNGSSAHFPGSSLPGPPFFTTVTQLEPHNLEMSTVATTPERQAIVGLAQPTPKVDFDFKITQFNSYNVHFLQRVLDLQVKNESIEVNHFLALVSQSMHSFTFNHF